MSYLFTSESVSEGHPDKVADQISDALLDEFMAQDPQSRVAIETLVTTGQVIVAGEVSTHADVDIPATVRKVITDIGYNRGAYRFDGDSCGILSSIHEQSPDINRGVDRENAEEQGAGDQGMMFGYATNETPNYMPLSLELSHMLMKEIAEIRREGKVMTYNRKGKLRTYLRPDAKSQVTIEYGEDRKAKRVHTIVVSTQHDEFVTPVDDSAAAQASADKEMLDRIRKDVAEILIPRVIAKLPAHLQSLFDDNIILHVNPTGKFVLGGPHADTGLTGRKIIVDTYGGRGAHGGGAFSGKDPSKVDRSAAYAARQMAKALVAAGIADEALVQVAYAIGRAEPVSIHVDTFGTSRVKLTDSEIAIKAAKIFDMRPAEIIRRLNLKHPIYLETATYGHMGRTPQRKKKEFNSRYNGHLSTEVDLFTWENVDKEVELLRKEFAL